MLDGEAKKNDIKGFIGIVVIRRETFIDNFQQPFLI